MNEGIPSRPRENATETKEKNKPQMIELARSLAESGEVFTFPGLSTENYALLKGADSEYTTPIDERIARLLTEGMKISLGVHPESGNFFMMPARSDDVHMDSMNPRHLNDGADDPRVARLIALAKA